MNVNPEVGIICKPNRDNVKNPNATEKSRKGSRAGGRGKMISNARGKKINKI
jgi:hypothetical protein